MTNLMEQGAADLSAELGQVAAKIDKNVLKEEDDLRRKSLGDCDGERVGDASKKAKGPVTVNPAGNHVGVGFGLEGDRQLGQFRPDILRKCG